ncbi:MAG: tRNA pseudouridine(38-40) synthase TruA [Myxococcota bacterium]
MSESLRNIVLVVEYDGGTYLGWQRQKDGPSIQAELERAVHSVTQSETSLTAAGRTDAGVHAIGQVVSFRTTSSIESHRFSHALNAHLPSTVTVHTSREMPTSFDPRLDSLSKRYRYRFYQGPHLPALEHGRVWHHRTALDLDAMRAASRFLIGELDFESFRSVHCDADHAVREMHSIDLSRYPRPPVGTYLDIEFHANAYCRHMCRILAGTLCDVGRGRFAAGDIERIREARDRRQAGVTAPPGGLTLIEVLYPTST